MFKRASSETAPRGAKWAAAAVLLAASVRLFADVPECYRARWAAIEQPGAGGNCSAYTECPTAIVCNKPGIKENPAGPTPNVATACVDYINGTYDQALGRCTGGTKVPGAPTLTRFISVDNCAGVCTVKVEDPPEE